MRLLPTCLFSNIASSVRNFLSRAHDQPKFSPPGVIRFPSAYPIVQRGNRFDDYKSAAKGVVSVHDPYQDLEIDSPERDAFVKGMLVLARPEANPC